MSQSNLLSVLAILTIIFCTTTINAQVLRDSSAEVVITDSKIERPIRQTARPVEVISQSTVQKYIGKTLDQLLEDQVGISINGGNSNPAAIKNIYVRGAAPGFTLILIDGLPATDASSIGSTIDFRLFDINQVERIEVAKGSQSTLYGSDAIAGVINIITKKGSADTFNVNANISAGSYNSIDAGASISGSTKGFNYNVGHQLSGSQGISEAFDPTDSDTFDKDGFTKRVTYGKFNVNLNDKWSISPSAQLTTFEGDYDAGAFTDGSDNYESELTNLGIKLNYNNDHFKFNAAFNNVDSKRSFFTEFGDFLFNGTTQNVDAYITHQKGDISLIGGVHYQNASIEDDSRTKINPSWNIISPYANFIYLKNNFQLETGVRFNSHSIFGGNFNYAITPSLFVSDNLKFYASYATAFKAPVLYELYGDGVFTNTNLDLTPQTSATFELGSNFYFEQGNLSITYFNRNIDDVIIFQSDPVTFVGQYNNINQQKDQGVEIAVNSNIEEGFNIQLSYTYLKGFAIDESGNETANLFKRPAHQVGFVLDYAASEKLNIRFVNQWNSKRADLFFSNATFLQTAAELKAYLRSDISLSYQSSRDIRLFGHVNNLFNNPYFETHGFSTQGINFRLGGSVQF